MIGNKTAWANFYSSPVSPESSNEFERRNSQLQVSASSHYVFRCFFENFLSRNSAVFVSASTNLLIEETTFDTCSTTEGTGGALTYSANGESILIKICGFNCKSSSNGQFSSVTLPDSSKNRNYLNESAISYTNNEEKYWEIMLQSGTVIVTAVNFSFNTCYYTTGAFVSGSKSTQWLISFSTFSNNTAKRYHCIEGGSRQGIDTMKSCNVIKNIQLSDEWSHIYAFLNLNIIDSCILENVGGFTISAEQGSISLSNCTFDGTTSHNVNVANSPSKAFIIPLLHLKTAVCDANYDSVGTLSALAIKKGTYNKRRIIVANMIFK